MDIVGSEGSAEVAVTGGEDEEFYEEIEAPKYVDFTAPDPWRPDGKSWFCQRIGCDQQHEEVDPDALFRSFKLRVLAARSPNVKLQRALNRQAPRSIKKCPQSAPAKSAKDRISRFSTVTSVAVKMAKTKLEIHPISSLRSTPAKSKAKVQPLSEKKALTTPRTKKCAMVHEPFCSVKCHKGTVAPLKNPSVVKELFSTTPKKNVEANEALNSVICDGMKMINLGTVKKHVPKGRLCNKSSMYSVACVPNHSKSTVRNKKKSEGLSLQQVTQEAEISSTLWFSKENHNVLVQAPIVDDSNENHNVLIQAVMEDDDDNKENDSSSSNLNSNATNSESESLQLETSDNIPQKEVKAPRKPTQERGVHARKVKRTTNPKPFRLRTDARGILKEANLEKKRLKLEAEKENAPISKHRESKHQYGKSAHEKSKQTIQDEKGHKTEPQYGKPAHEKSKQTIQDEKGHKIEPNRTRIQPAKRVRVVESRYATTISKSHMTEKKELEKSLNKTANMASSVKTLNTQSLKVERKVQGSQFKGKEPFSTRSEVYKSTMAKGKKPSTIPKESNFHRLHVPNNCTRTPLTIISS